MDLRTEGRAVSPSPGVVSSFPKGNQELHYGNSSSRAGAGGSPWGRRFQPRVSRHFKASSGDSGLLDPLPGARRSPSSAPRRGPPPHQPGSQPTGPSPGNSRQRRGPWEAQPGNGSFPLPSSLALGAQAGARPVREVTRCSWAVTHLFLNPPGRGGAGARFPRPQTLPGCSCSASAPVQCSRLTP